MDQRLKNDLDLKRFTNYENLQSTNLDKLETRSVQKVL